MFNKFIVLLFIIFIIPIINCCVYDYECTINGVPNNCVNGQCLNKADCMRDIDCLSRGVYLKCSNGNCVKSDHKLCVSDDDCKENTLHTRCIANQCSI